MLTRNIGSLEVSALGLGGNNFGARLDAAQTREIVHAALDAGVTFFDTADVYGQSRSEEYLGQALKGRRDQAVIATKFGARRPDGTGGAKPEAVRNYLDASLKRLGVDEIDLYQLHMPDPDTPIADTLGTLAELVAEGKVREIGCSNFNVEQLRAAQDAASSGIAGFASVQNEYSLLWREPERDILPECAQSKIAFIPFFPLASGLLTGKYRREEPAPEGTRRAMWPAPLLDRLWTDANFAAIDRLDEFARDHGHTLLELALSWLLAQDAVTTVIAGATSIAQLRANVASATWQLSADELATITSLAPITDEVN